MANYEFQFSDYNRIVFRQFRFIAIVVAAAAMVGLVIGRWIPKTYRATAVVQADFDLFFEGARVDPSLLATMEETVGAMMTDITGYAVLLRAAKKLLQIDDALTQAQVMHDEAALLAIDRLRGMVTPSPGVERGRIEIRVTASQPDEASAAANAVADAYHEFAYDNKRGVFLKRRQRVKESLDTCRGAMAAAAARMVDARKQRRGLIDMHFHSKKLVEADSVDRRGQRIGYELEMITARHAELTLLRKHLRQRQSTAGGGEGGAADLDTRGDHIAGLEDLDPGLAILCRQLSGLDARRMELLRFYRPGHPSVTDLDGKMVAMVDRLLSALDVVATSLRRDHARTLELADTIAELLRRQPDDENALEWMQRGYSVREEVCESIEAELTEVEVMMSGLVPYVTVIREAAIPGRSSGPGASMVAAIATVIGFLLGVLLSIFREMADRSLGTVEDVRRALPGRRVLTAVPRIKAAKRSLRAHAGSAPVFDQYRREFLPVLFDPAGACGESFSALAAQLNLQKVERECAVVLVTSSMSGEGKTVVAANLALALARQGDLALLLEADFRRPALGPLFGLPALPGLSHLLVDERNVGACRLSVSDLIMGSLDWSDIVKTNGIGNFFLIPSGSFPPDPGEMLISGPMVKLIGELREDYDYIIIDTPPVAPFGDALQLSRHCDGTLIVYRSDGAPREVVTQCITKLESTGARFLGLVLNGWHDAVIDVTDAGRG